MLQKKLYFYSVLFCLSFGFFACVQKIPHSIANKNISFEEALAHYDHVLKTYVNQKGQVDFKGIREQPSDLNAFVQYIAHTPFSEFKNNDEKLAYFINAYNAMSMYHVINSYIPTTNKGFGKIKFFFLTKFKIGGDNMSLYTFENKYIRKNFDERIHFVLNCMSLSCPILPQHHFSSEHIDQELNDARTHFFSEKRNLHTSEQEKKVYVSEILKFYQSDFISEANPSLIDYINRHTGKKIPTNYKVEFIKYDWTINDQD